MKFERMSTFLMTPGPFGLLCTFLDLFAYFGSELNLDTIASDSDLKYNKIIRWDNQTGS